MPGARKRVQVGECHPALPTDRRDVSRSPAQAASCLPDFYAPSNAPAWGMKGYPATLPRVAAPLRCPKTGHKRVSRYPPFPRADPSMPHAGASKGMGIPSGGWSRPFLGSRRPSGGSRRGSVGSWTPSDGYPRPSRGSLTPFSGECRTRRAAGRAVGGAVEGRAGRGAGCRDTAPVGRPAGAGRVGGVLKQCRRPS